MSKSNKAAKSALIIIIFSLGSKFLGFFREILIASKFGSGVETDTFFIALSAASLISGFITSSISTTSIPVLSEIESKEGKNGKLNHANNMINIIFMLSVILLLIGYVFAPIIVKLLAKDFEGEQLSLAIRLTRIGFPTILFGGIIGIFTGYLQSDQRFTATSSIGLPFNFVYIFFLLFLSSLFGIKGLMITSVVASASQLIVLLPEARNIGYKYSFRFDLKDIYIRRVILLSLPILIGVAINDLNAIIDKTLASGLVSGSISALNYANKLNGLILSVFISAITTVIFPLLAKESNDDNISGMKRIMGYGINLILLITIPATIGIIALSNPIVEIAFQRGEFDSTATLMTSQAMVYYSLGLVGMALNPLIIRVYYSLQDTKTPMINGAISVGFNIILNLILVKYMAHAGLALATSIATTIATIILLYGLKQKIGSLGTKVYITTFLKTGLASLIMGIVAYFTYYGLYNFLGVSKLYNLVSLLISVGISVIVYVVLCYILGVVEVIDGVKKVKERLKI